VRLESEIRHIRLAVVEEKQLFVGIEIVVLFESVMLSGNLPDLRILLRGEPDRAEHGVVHPAIDGDEARIRQNIKHAAELPVSPVDENR
jgi:hypothetical protein